VEEQQASNAAIEDLGQQRFELPSGGGEPEARRGGSVLGVAELCAAMPRTAGDIGRELGCGRTATYRHIARAIEHRLVRRHSLLRGVPALLAATAEGHRLVGSGLSVARISPASARHWIECSRVAATLTQRHPDARLLSEAELRLREELTGRALASAQLGELPDGRPRLHRPDLVLTSHAGRTAVEVELTLKASRRLRAIISAWRRASCVSQVLYICSPRTHRVVSRVVGDCAASERVVVSLLEDLS
jgi:hypothetical protein